MEKTIAVIGSMREKEEGRDFGVEREFRKFRLFCYSLGAEIAQAGHKLCIAWSQNNASSQLGQHPESGTAAHKYWETADYHALCGYWDAAQQATNVPGITLILAGPSLPDIRPFDRPIEAKGTVCYKGNTTEIKYREEEEWEYMQTFGDKFRWNNVEEFEHSGNKRNVGNVPIFYKWHQNNHAKRQLLISGSRSSELPGVTGLCDIIFSVAGGKATQAMTGAAREAGKLVEIDIFHSKQGFYRSSYLSASSNLENLRKLNFNKKEDIATTSKLASKFLIKESDILILKTARHNKNLIPQNTYMSILERSKSKKICPSIFIMSVIEKEFLAMQTALQAGSIDGELKIPGADGLRVYQIGDGENGHSRLVGHVQHNDQGPFAAAQKTREIIDLYKPDLIVTTGICGGTPSPDHFLGDVVLADNIHDCTVGKLNDENQLEATRSTPIKIDEFAIELVHGYKKWYIENPAHLNLDYPKIESEAAFDSLCNIDNSLREEYLKRLHSAFIEFQNRQKKSFNVVVGPIVASGSLMRSIERVEKWLNTWRQLRAFDMEAAGVFYEANCNDPIIPTVSIRGISDIVGIRREEAWTEYACSSTAAVTVNFVQYLASTASQHLWDKVANKR
jgi:nucleoside phosphorylase